MDKEELYELLDKLEGDAAEKRYVIEDLELDKGVIQERIDMEEYALSLIEDEIANVLQEIENYDVYAADEAALNHWVEWGY